MDFWNPPFDDMRPVLTLVGTRKLDGDFLLALNKSNIKYQRGVKMMKTDENTDKPLITTQPIIK